MKIYYNDTYTEVQPKDSSYRIRQIGDYNMVSLEFSLTYFVDFPIGSHIVFEGGKYKTYAIFPFTKVNDRQYDYVLSFFDNAKSAENYKFRNHVDRRLKFTLTAKPHEFVEHIVENLNERDTETERWSVGDCVDCNERTQSFSHNSIREALDSIAKLFDTEWEIDGKRINLRKTEYNKDMPLELSYGKGNGFKSGIGRTLSEEQAVDVLFVEGGERNIDQSKYTYDVEIEGVIQTLHADTLRLPKNETFYYFPPQTDGIENPDNKDYGTIKTATEFWSSSKSDLEKNTLAAKAFVFHTDKDGFSMYRDTYLADGYEDSLDLTDIYPMREEIIESVVCEDGRPVYDANGKVINKDDKHFYDLILSENVVNYGDNKIWESGEQVTIIFQNGMLQGKEFNVSKYVANEKRLKIQPAEIDGIKMPDPDSGYMPKIGEKFAVFHIKLPDEYISQAERKMALQAAYYLWKHSEPEVEFHGSIDGIWAKKNWADIRNKIGLGYYVKFSDNDIAKDGKLMRIIAIKDYINNPHFPELTLSNTTVAQGVSSQLKEIAQNEVYTQKQISDVVQFAKRSFKDSEETLKLVEQHFVDKYSEGISPSDIHTVYALFGDSNLQFEFGTVELFAKEVKSFQVVTWEPTFDEKTRILHVRNDLFLRNRGLAKASNCRNVIGNIDDNCYPYWAMQLPSNEIAIDAEKDNVPFYLYACVSKSYRIGFVVEQGEYVLSENKLTDSADNYYFLIGILNSANENGNRSFISLYGMTEIGGGRISTELIRSNDGTTYIDLKNNVIAGKINFKDGLISNRIWVGKSEDTATAGFGGTDYFSSRSVVLWAGKNGDVCRLKIYDDGSIYWFDENGNVEMSIFPSIGAFLDYLTCGRILAQKNITCSGEIQGNFRPDVPLANNVKALPYMYVPVWIGRVYFNNNQYYSSYSYRAQVKQYSGKYDSFDITVGWLGGDGQCSVVFDYPFSAADDYFVTFQGSALNKNWACYACIQEKRNNGFFALAADDNTPNNLNFYMQIWARTT